MSSKRSASKEKMLTNGKLKKKCHLTLSDKISIIQDYHKTRCQKGVLAALHNCYEAQINYILKEEKKYVKQWAQKTGITINTTQSHKNFKPMVSNNTSKRIVIGAVIYEWIKRTRYHGLSITHNEIRAVAKEVSKLINCNNFQATDLWINKLKQKYRITDLGPVNSKKLQSKLSKKSCDVKNILIEFKERGPPSHLNRSFLNDIDLSKLKLIQNKKVKAKSDTNKNSEVSELFSTESTDFITAMLIDDGDKSPATSEKQFSVEVQNNYIITANKINEEQKVQRPIAKTISCYKEALEYLRPLENFSLMQEDVRALKRISKLERLFAEELLTSSV